MNLDELEKNSFHGKWAIDSTKKYLGYVTPFWVTEVAEILPGMEEVMQNLCDRLNNQAKELDELTTGMEQAHARGEF